MTIMFDSTSSSRRALLCNKQQAKNVMTSTSKRRQSNKELYSLRSSRTKNLLLSLFVSTLFICLLQQPSSLFVVEGWTRTTMTSSSSSVSHRRGRHRIFVNEGSSRSNTYLKISSANENETWFGYDQLMGQRPQSLTSRKAALLQLGASLDRGQAYNPTSGAYYKQNLQVAKRRIDELLLYYPDRVPSDISEMEGEWELVLSTVPHGIFRSSPFFLAIQEAYELYSRNKYIGGVDKQTGLRQTKAELFFKLHELQTCSWGISKIGRVAQHITPNYLYSEFDTSIFSLTVIPILGWFKLLPTFGGCVVTAAKITAYDYTSGLLSMKVDYTTARKVPGLSGLGSWIWNIRVPVGSIWKFLPWNGGRDADCRVYIRYCDDDFRIVEDLGGDYFVYTRPVISRDLDLIYEEQSGAIREL